MSARPVRGLVLFEIAAVIAIAVIPWPPALPLAIPLVIVASIALWIRGASWADVTAADGTQALVGLGAGAAALGLALVAGTPLVEAVAGRTVEWSANAVVRGNAAMLGGVVIYAAIVALCMELALRGWIVDRVLGLTGWGRSVHAVLAVLAGAFVEALLTPGELAVRIGAGVFGIGLGWMFVAAKRNVVAPLLARLAFGVGAVVLEAVRLVG